MRRGAWVPEFLLGALLLGALGSGSPPAAGGGARVGARLERALRQTLPNQGIAIGVTLRADDLPGAGSARGAAIGARRARVLAAVPLASFRAGRMYPMLSGFSGRAQRRAIEALRRHPEVVSIYLDGIVHAELAEGVPLVGAPAAHALGFTGIGVTVAVLDTGIDVDHPDLQGAIVAEQCFCDDNPAPRRGCCPNGKPTESGAGSARDDDGHGTNVAGIVASRGIVASPGVAPAADLVAVKVLAQNGSGSFSDVASGLDWALANWLAFGIRAVNLSLGDGEEYNDPTLFPCAGTNVANAIQSLNAAGVAVFIASGNEGFDNGISFPACVTGAISVGGVYDAGLGSVSWCANAACTSTLCTDAPTSADRFVCHTNSDELLDLLAPDWRTTTPDLGGGVVAIGGTSAASPYAAGEAALLLQADGSLTPAGLLTLLQAHGPGVTNPDNGLSFVRAAVDGALAELTGDTDLDGILDDGDASGTPGDAPCAPGQTAGCDDSCARVPNPGQEDAGGLFGPAPNGIGDVCECGDADEDGLLDAADVSAMQLCLGGNGACSPRCDADASGACDAGDAPALRAALAGGAAPSCTL